MHKAIIYFLLLCSMGVAAQNEPKAFNGAPALHVCKAPEQQALQLGRQQQLQGNSLQGRILRQALHIRLDPRVRAVAGFVDYRLLLQRQQNELFVDLHEALWSSADSMVYDLRTNQYIALSLPSTGIGTALGFNIPLAGYAAGDTVQLRIRYGGVPPVNANSFGSFRTATHGPANSPVLWTLSQPYSARDWWPNFQPLGYKADTTELHVTTPPGFYAGGPGLLQIDTVNGEWVHHWRHYYPCPPYLLGTAVSDYAIYAQKVALTGTADSLLVLNYLYAEDTAVWRQRLDDWLPPMVNLFRDLFGEYPFKSEKYGHMQISNGNGGMEHNTMSSMGDYGYELMAHELAHMWFGNKVTCANWQDIWVNEGFATWMTGLCLERLLDNGYWWEPWKRLTRISALTSPDLVVYKVDTTVVAKLFESRSTYHKASFVLHQLRFQLGDSVVFAAFRDLMTDSSLAYGFMSSATVKSKLEKACGCSLDRYFNEWIYNGGHPEYEFRYRPTGFGVELFVHDRSLSAPAAGYDLQLPFRAYAANGDSVDFTVQTAGRAFYTNKVLPFAPVALRFDPDIHILAAYTEPRLETVADRLVLLYPPGENYVRVMLPADWRGQLHSVLLWDYVGREHWRYVPDIPTLGFSGEHLSVDVPVQQLRLSTGVISARHPDGRVVTARLHDIGLR